MAPRPALQALADRLGILPEYATIDGRRHRTTNATREALARAMRIDASSESGAASALAAIDAAEAAGVIAPVRVIRSRDGGNPPHRARRARSGPIEWIGELREESGRVHPLGGRIARGAALLVPLPTRLPPGYHRLAVSVRDPAGERRGEQLLIVAPASCFPVRAATRGRAAFGIIANLYSVRSRGNWGAGDLSDLAALARWCARVGGTFVGVNPLHATRNRGSDVSPYAPLSRVYRNPLYLDLGSIPELGDAPEARALIGSRAFRAELDRVRAADHIEYDRVMTLKERALTILHRAFAVRHAGRGTERGRAYARYVEREGDALLAFATFQALERRFRAAGVGAWREWPAAFRDLRSWEVRDFREREAGAVDYHRWLQFELDRQLADAQRGARAAGLAIGIYQDLAVGAAGGGSDVWTAPDLFADGARVGAPPDPYAPAGQDWGFPPLDPHALRRDRYHYWIAILRSALAHAGALRIDHAMGLLRLFWLPPGGDARDGAYVRYPAADLLGILALESRRHRAIVIGEDLGTVPPGFAALLARWGILSSRVMYFERDRRGYRPSRSFSARALVTATTHDLPPLAGFLEGTDLEQRRRAGQLADAALGPARAERERALADLRRRLRAEGCLGAEPVGTPRFAAAVYCYLSRTRAPLVGAALDDLAGERLPVNLPGVGPDRYPSWCRRMAAPLDALVSDPGAGTVLRGLRQRRRRSRR